MLEALKLRTLVIGNCGSGKSSLAAAMQRDDCGKGPIAIWL